MQLAALLLTASALVATPDLTRELQGVRSNAMGGAHRGVGTSNDAIIVNPSGMAVLPRYGVELQYGYAPSENVQRFHASVVDSKSGRLAAGLAYTHDRGTYKGVDIGLHRIYLAAAYPILPNLGLGVTARNTRGDVVSMQGQQRDISEYSADLGLTYVTSFGATLGAAYQGVLRGSNTILSPPVLGFGASYSAGMFTLASDLLFDLRDQDIAKPSYLAGAELFVARSCALRAGYSRRPIRGATAWLTDEDMLSGGIAFSDGQGSLDVSYRQSIDRLTHWELIAGFKLFM